MMNKTISEAELITPEMRKVLDKMFPQLNRTYSHYDVERALEAIIPMAYQAGYMRVVSKRVSYEDGFKAALEWVLEKLEGLKEDRPHEIPFENYHERMAGVIGNNQAVDKLRQLLKKRKEL